MSNYKRMYLQGYDYVFFTIVTNNRENILIENIDLLRESFKNALENFEFNIMKDLGFCIQNPRSFLSV